VTDFTRVTKLLVLPTDFSPTYRFLSGLTNLEYRYLGYGF